MINKSSSKKEMAASTKRPRTARAKVKKKKQICYKEIKKEDWFRWADKDALLFGDPIPPWPGQLEFLPIGKIS